MQVRFYAMFICAVMEKIDKGLQAIFNFFPGCWIPGTSRAPEVRPASTPPISTPSKTQAFLSLNLMTPASVMTFYLPQFFCPKILAQNTESYNGKQYFKIGGIERTFKERSLEKLRFGSERVVTGVTREKSRLTGKLRTRAERGNGFVIIRKS